MTPDTDAEFALTRELRAAAESAVQPTPERLYAGAVGRGRRIRRTAIVKRTLAGAAALGVVAAVAVPLVDGAPRPASAGVAAPSSPRTPSSPKSAAGSPKAAQKGPVGTAWMPSYVLETLKSLLPAGSTTTKEDSLGGVPLEVFAPDVTAPGGQSLALVRADLETPNGRSTISLSVGRYASTLNCPSRAVAPHDVCSATPLDGGTFYVDKSFKDYSHGTGAAIWTMIWNGPDGQSLYLGESTDAPAQALTAQQAETLFTAPAWDRVWQALPPACALGVMPNPQVTRTEVQEQGNVFVCATSRAAALPR